MSRSPRGPGDSGEHHHLQPVDHEMLLDDATQLATRAAAVDVTITLDVVAGVPHVFQSFAGVLDEADAALDRAASFIRERMSSVAASPH